MRYFVLAVISLVTLGLSAPAPAQETPADLLAFSYAVALATRDRPVSYTRYVLRGGVELEAALAALEDGADVARFFVILPGLDDTATPPVLEERFASTEISQDALAFAGAYIPAPSTILDGYLQAPPIPNKTDRGTMTYVLPIAGSGKSTTTASIELDTESALLMSSRIGGDDPDALVVTYAYGESLAPEVVVTQFSMGGDPVTRWTLVDLLSDETVALPAAGGSGLDDTNAMAPTLAQMATAKGVDATTITFSDEVNTLPPINLGSTSCNASSGICFDLVLVDVCFNVGIGVGLSTVTSISMNGMASVEYPVDGQPGMANISFDSATGNSSIDYSLAYDAEICGSFTFPIVGTCNAGVRLARGNYNAASGTQAFTSFLLPGAADRPVCTGDTIGASTVGVNPGLNLCDIELSLTGGLSINPNINYCVRGDRVAVAPAANPDGVKDVASEGGATLVAAQEGLNTYDATWSGMPSIDGTVTLQPSLGITAPILGDLSVPFPSFSPSIPSLNLSEFTLTDSFSVELQQPGIGNLFGCFENDATKTPRTASGGFAMAPLALVAFGLLLKRTQSGRRRNR